ncbi:MAG: hypothetical protein KGZ60_04730 [Truepera sp.]|nr:hypothetical protein [Truepera sp.]
MKRIWAGVLVLLVLSFGFVLAEGDDPRRKDAGKVSSVAVAESLER